MIIIVSCANDYTRGQLMTRSWNKALMSLAGSTWRVDKESLLTSYKAKGRSVVNYMRAGRGGRTKRPENFDIVASHVDHPQ